MDTQPQSGVTRNHTNGHDAESEQSLWQRFSAAATTASFANGWLALQCGIVKDVCAGVLLLNAGGENRPFENVAAWPENHADLAYLTEIAERSLRERRGVVIKRGAEQTNGSTAIEHYEIAYPVQVANRVFGVVTLDLAPRAEAQLNDALRQLQWGCAWLEVLFHRRESGRSAAPAQRIQAVLDLMAGMAGQEKFAGAAFAFVTELATRFGCDRVSLGFLRQGQMRIEALSHSAQFTKETNLLRAIAAAMDEAVDQQSKVVFQAGDATNALIARSHEELSRQYGNGAICTLPLSAYGVIVGALTLERTGQEPFDAPAVETFEAIASLAGPALENQRRNDRGLIARAKDRARLQIERLTGPSHMTLKLVVYGTALLILVLSIIKGDYRVTAKTVIEPTVRRAVVAAFNGYIGSAPLRAGDLIQEGKLLATLDDRELKLERSKWLSQQEQSLKQYYEALGSRNAAQIQILTAQVDQARAQVALVEDQLARTQILAPFNGVVVAGDLSQSIGSPVERGQVLFEVAPLDAYRIILQVDEHNIAELRLRQSGQIILSGFPSQPLRFTVEKLTPVSTASEGRNYFRVEAKLQKVPEGLRPGMEGVSKIEIDRRRLIWIWTHEVTNWIRLKLWAWLP